MQVDATIYAHILNLRYHNRGVGCGNIFRIKLCAMARHIRRKIIFKFSKWWKGIRVKFSHLYSVVVSFMRKAMFECLEFALNLCWV